jgi:peptide/nickel transport system permease protein
MPEQSPSPIAVADPELNVGAGVSTMSGPLGTALVLEGTSSRRRFGLFRNLITIIAGLWMAAVVFVAVFADVLPFVRPANETLRVGRYPPFQNSTVLLGTDQNGRDILSYCIYGARWSLIIGFCTVALAMLIGGSLGLAAGYFRTSTSRALQWFDNFFSGLTDVMLAFPGIILLLFFIVVWGREPFKVTLALTVLSIAPLFKLSRASTLVYAQREFVMASRALGASNLRIMFKELLPNVVPVALSFSLLSVAIIIVALGALDFIGLGLENKYPTWGSMIATGKNDLGTHGHIALAPCGIMFLTVLSLNLLGDKLRSRFDIREGAI